MKLHPNNLSPRHLVIIGMSVATFLLLLIGGLQWESGNDFRISKESVTHTRTVLLDLESILTSMTDAQTAQRMYLLVHKDTYLEPYQQSMVFTRDQIQALRQLIANPEQQKNLDRLAALINARFDELDQPILLEQNGDRAGAVHMSASVLGKNTMDDIQATIRTMQDAEAALFQQREEAFQKNSRINSQLSILLMVLVLDCIVAIFFFLLLRRLERMQEMITICAWSKLIEFEGEWLTIEEYLSRRLDARITHGISQAEAEKMRTLLEYEKRKKAAQSR